MKLHSSPLSWAQFQRKVSIMPSKPPVGVSAETLDPDAERLIESELQAS